MTEDKYIDEDWKDAVAREKEKGPKQSQPQPPQQPQAQQPPAQEEAAEEEPAPPTDITFLNYISSLAYQAMFFLGEIPNPVDNRIEVNLEQAKFTIDTLLLLRHKTKGNLNKQEADMLNGSLYELQMKYVELVKNLQKKQP